MNLTHYAKSPRRIDRARTYAQRKPESFTYKPRGLWVSVDGEDDWPAWCRSEDFAVESLRYAHRVTLAAQADVLHIATAEQFDAFHSTFAVEFGEWYRGAAIDWPAVAARYDGIIIAPFQHLNWLKHMWYYGWDCSSGVIWNLNAIEDVTLLCEH